MEKFIPFDKLSKKNNGKSTPNGALPGEISIPSRRNLSEFRHTKETRHVS